MWQVFISFDVSDENLPVDESTHEYLIESIHMGGAIEKALQELLKAQVQVNAVHALSVKLLPPVIA